MPHFLDPSGGSDPLPEDKTTVRKFTIQCLFAPEALESDVKSYLRDLTSKDPENKLSGRFYCSKTIFLIFR